MPLPSSMSLFNSSLGTMIQSLSMPRVCTLLLIYLYLQISQTAHAITIDNFQTEGRINNLRLRRNAQKAHQTTDGLTLLENGYLYEMVAKPTKFRSLEGKSIQVEYSADESGPLEMSIRLLNKQAQKNKLIIDLYLLKGYHQVVTVPASEFMSKYPLEVTQLGIKGQMTIHQIDIVADTCSHTTHSAVPIADLDNEPNFLIDDFRQWTDSLENVLNGARQVSKTAILKRGVISLLHRRDYLIEMFSDDKIVQNLPRNALRIVYTSNTLKDQLLGCARKIPTGLDKTFFRNLKFPMGRMKELIVPVSTFIQFDPEFTFNSTYGIVFRGPLKIHRIELVLNVIEHSPIPSQFTQPSQIIGSNKLIEDDQSLFFMMKYAQFQDALSLILIRESFRLDLQYTRVLTGSYKVMHANAFKMELDVNIRFDVLDDDTQSKSLYFAYLQSEIFAPENQLFDQTDDLSFRIIPNHQVSHLLLDYYRFVGQALAMGILNREMQSVKFVPMIYRILLGKPLQFADVEHIYPSIVAEIGDFCRAKVLGGKTTMSVSYTDPYTPQKFIQNLIPNGQNVIVDENNRIEYMSALLLWHGKRLIGAQVESLRSGFHEVIPPGFLAAFDEVELEHIMAGCPSGHESLPQMGEI